MTRRRRRAEAAGIKVVMNRCPKIEYGRLSGEIGWNGVNSRRAVLEKADHAARVSRVSAFGEIERRPFVSDWPRGLSDADEQDVRDGIFFFAIGV